MSHFLEYQQVLPLYFRAPNVKPSDHWRRAADVEPERRVRGRGEALQAGGHAQPDVRFRPLQPARPARVDGEPAEGGGPVRGQAASHRQEEGAL